MIYTNDDDTGIIKTSGAMSLPGDILLNIDNYLWPEDRYACLFVCRQWYTTFLARFYTSITIQTTHQCEQLCNAFEMTISKQQQQSKGEERQLYLLSPGHTVRELHMSLCTEDLEKLSSTRLPNHFPSLRSFTVSSFQQQQQHYHHQQQENHGNSNHSDQHPYSDGDITTASATTVSCGKIAPTKSIIGISIDTFWTLPSDTLTRLHFSIPRLQRDAVIRLLHKLPRLTSLYLNWINGSWLCSDMNDVHQYCPELQHVWIFAETFHTLSQVTERQPEPNRPINEDDIGFVDDIMMNHSDDDIVNFLFPPTPSSHVPVTAEKLTHFHLSIYRGLPEHMSDWFVYAARTYPQLESFTLETRPKHLDRVGERAFEYDLLDMLMTYKWASRIWKQAETPSFRYFIQHCPHVTAINLFQLYLNRQFLESIFECRLRIQHFGSTRNIHNIWTVDNNWYFSESLVSLSLQACVTPPANNVTFMKFLGSLIHLKHLTLARYEYFELSSLTEACPGLETLILEHMAVVSPPTLNNLMATNNDDDNNHANLTFIEQQLQQRQWQWQQNWNTSDEQLSITDNEDETTTALKQLTIRQTVLKESFFHDIPCSLEKLIIENSAVIANDPYRATIEMPPNLSLDTLDINHLIFEDQNSMRKVVKQNGQQFSVIGIQQQQQNNNDNNNNNNNSNSNSNSNMGISHAIGRTTQWYDFRYKRNQNHNEKILGIRPMAPKEAEDMLEDDEGTGDEVIYGLEISCRSIQRACVNNLRLLQPAQQVIL